MTDLMKDKASSDARYGAAKSITKKLAGLPEADRLTVLRHVATELGMDVVPLVKPNGTATAKAGEPAGGKS